MDELEPTNANLRTYLQIIGRRFAWLLAVTVLCVSAAVAFSVVQKKQYSAAASLLVQPAGGSLAGTQVTVSPTDVLTELQLVKNAPVKEEVTQKLGFTPKISVAEVGQTNVINLTAAAPNPREAAEVANVYAQTFVAYQQTEALNTLTAAEQQIQGQITAIQSQLKPLEAESAPSAGATSTISALANQEAVLKEQLAQFQVTGTETPGGIELVSPASPPTSPSSPKPLRNGIIALVVGLLLGAGAAFSAEYFDDKVYTKDEAERLSGGVPVLALVPRVKRWKKSRTVLIAEKTPFSPATEAYRTLRTSLQFAGDAGQLKTILVTSASGAEGKTSTVANLGVVMAKAGESVVIVSCDLRRPRVGRFFKQTETPGFTSVLLGQNELKHALKPVINAPGRLTLLGSGPIPPNPAELLGSERAADIFRLLAADFDYVLIDSPPLLPVADPLVLSGYADAVLLVVMAGLTKRGNVERANELLVQVDAHLAGIVLNKATRRSAQASGYGYSYPSYPQWTPEVIQNEDIRSAHSNQRPIAKEVGTGPRHSRGLGETKA
jgi:polysaccharide biosynthesis transport protein